MPRPGRLSGLLAASSLALGLGLPASLPAQDFSDRAGTAEFQYLGILIFARPAGMAGAYTSLAEAEDAIGYNPAGLSRLERPRSFSGTFRYHMVEVSSGNVTYAFPGSGGMQYAFSAAFLNYGRMEGLDEDGNSTGSTLTPSSFNPSLTASRKVSERTRVGATLKGVSEYLGDFEGSRLAWGWGVDLGLQYQPKVRNLGFGAALLNFGRKESAHFEGGGKGGALPVGLKGGMYYYPLDLPKTRVAADLEIPWHDAPLLSGGLEYTFSPALQVRAGTRFDLDELAHYLDLALGGDSGDLAGGNALKLAGGFTFQADGVAVDYAAQYWRYLSWVHAVTIRYAIF